MHTIFALHKITQSALRLAVALQSIKKKKTTTCPFINITLAFSVFISHLNGFLKICIPHLLQERALKLTHVHKDGAPVTISTIMF